VFEQAKPADETLGTISPTEVEEIDVEAGFIIGSTCCSLELSDDDEEVAPLAATEKTLTADNPNNPDNVTS